MKRFILQALLAIFCFSAEAQERNDAKLTKQLEDVIAGFHGQVGIYVKNLSTNKVVSINADTIFPTASMVKIPILIGIMDKLERHELLDTQHLVYTDSLLYEGVDILGSFKNNETIELQKVMMLMLTMSDNTASLWLQQLAGTGSRINNILDSLGFKVTRVNSRTPGREAFRSMYGWGQSSPREMASLMEKIYRGEIINRKAGDRMLRLLSRNFWDEYAISQIPAGVFVASKGGAVDQTRNEVLFVNAKRQPYIFCICTKNNEDMSWENTNEAWVMTRKVSALLWDYFEGSKKRR